MLVFFKEQELKVNKKLRKDLNNSLIKFIFKYLIVVGIPYVITLKIERSFWKHINNRVFEKTLSYKEKISYIL